MFKRILVSTAIIIAVTSASIHAYSMLETIKVYRGGIKVVINNKQVHLEEQPFIYNDRVYVPLRFVSEKLGKKVEWGGESRTVLIWDPGFSVPLEICHPEKGEIFVYGKISRIDFSSYTIEVEQHFDDNSVQVKQPLSVREDVVVILQENGERNIHFCQLKAGDTGGFILDSTGKVRGIIVSR